MIGISGRGIGVKIPGLFLLAHCFFSPALAGAGMMTFDEEYHYDAGEADSKLTCRAISLLEVKKLLLERLGTYIESSSQVVDLQLTRDEVTSLSAGIVKTEIIDEQWDGRTYSLTARIQADPDSVARILDEIASGGKKEEEIAKLEELNRDGLERINQLKQQMSAIQKDLLAVNRDYQQASKVVDSWGAYELGLEMMRDGQYREAADTFTRSIENNPTLESYLWRGKAYWKMEKNEKAMADLENVIEMNPKVGEAYFLRGKILLKNRKKREGLENIREAARLGNGKARLWLKAKGK